MNKEEILDRIFSIASFYEDSIDRLVANNSIDSDDAKKMKEDLEALRIAVDYFSDNYNDF